MIAGDREVVDHRRPTDVDRYAPHERSAGVGHVVLEVGRERRVAEEQHLAGLGVDLGMSRHRAREPSGEIVDAYRVEHAGNERGR